MLTDDLKQITNLHPIKINYNLHKWAFGEKTPITIYDDNESQAFRGFGENTDVWDGVSVNVKRRFNSEFLRGLADLYIKFRMVFTKPKKDPVKVFMGIKTSFDQLKPDNTKNDKEIEKMLHDLEKSKQKTASNTIKKELSLAQLERRLIQAGFTQYQTEESLIKFIKQCKKGLCLTEIERFERVIPTKVMLRFDAAEATNVFDNYFVLYYDPKQVPNKYYKEVRPEKDPILFGAIKGSTKLYFVADWIDEHCNLTYKDILAADCAVDYRLDK